MGVHTVLVSSETPDDDAKNFSAVNLALEVDQADIGGQVDLKKPNLEYAETMFRGDASSSSDNGKATSTSSDTASDSQSTGSRTESPDSSNPAVGGHSTISLDYHESPSTSCGTTPTPLHALVASGKAGGCHPDLPGTVSATAAAYEIKSEPACPIIAPHFIPPLLALKPTSEQPTKKKGVRKTLSTGWTCAKRLQTLPRDLRALARYLRLLYRMRSAKRANLNVPTAFDETTAKHPQKIAFHFEDESWTFSQVQSYSLRIASVFKGKVAKGDAVALMMENRIEYIAVWLGLSRLGAVPALLNTNLRQKSLTHCVTSADCKIVICGVELQDAIRDILPSIPGVPLYVSGSGETDVTRVTLPGAKNLDALQATAPTLLPPEQKTVNFADKIVYIYTSGTTGLPKAAVITHSRFIFASTGMVYLVGLTPSDVLYEPLPLYHTAGGNIGVGMALCDGITVAIRRKFSVTNYFPDCHKYGCTVAQYIGEICRYLLNSEPTPADKQHKLRVMFGNGLRPQIWEQFQHRFNIPRISEFYGSTEGNANIINMDGRVGAVGFLSVLLPFVYPCALIRVDTETGKPLRDSNGVCIRCKPGEPGEFVGKIIANDPVREFKGYADKKATSKKIVHDVFKKGDSAFLSGDLLVMDDEGYLFFKDRTGDTFRWKGENVSTAEVENHLSSLVKSTDLCVYGVEIPNTEGRAGMAAVLDADGSLDVASVAKGVTALLPAYARPLFMRTVKHIEMTGTYKLRKTDLQKEAYNIRVIKDPVYFLDTKKVAYVPLTESLYEKILSGEVRV